MENKDIEEYEIFYKDTLIGILKVDLKTNKHCFVPNRDGVNKVKDRACLLKCMENGTNGFEENIPFFENRLRNMKRLGLTVGNYQTDNFVLRLIK